MTNMMLRDERGVGVILDREPTPLYYGFTTLPESKIQAQELKEDELPTSGGWRFARPDSA